MPSRAAIYIRMSTDEQTNSPERQRTQIEAYCKRQGYAIVRQYEDLGLRGHDDTRPQFQKLIADAQGKLFDVVVVDEQSRLARNDVVSFVAKTVAPLRDAGVVIDTVAKGLIDWDDLGGFIVGAVSQHAASGEVITLSRRVVTELARKALKGDVVAGKPPYGYTQVWVDRAGAVVHRGKRNWSKRPTDWEPTLEINEDEAEVVRWVFKSYLKDDQSLNGIMKELRRRGVLSPRGGAHWSRAHLRNLLMNRVYVGDYVFNRVSVGSFHKLGWEGDGENRVGVAEAKKVKRAPGQKCNPLTKNDEKDWVVITSHHPAIIDRETFQQVQAVLKSNKARTTPAPGRGDYCLSKLLVCAKCGSWMVGDREGERKFYICGGYAQYGPDHCSPFRIREDQALDLVVRDFARYCEPPEQMEALSRVIPGTQDRAADNQIIRTRQLADDLAAKITKGMQNILLLEPELVHDAQAPLRQWKKEQIDAIADAEQLEREIDDVDTQPFFAALKEYASGRQVSWTDDNLRRLRRAMHALVTNVVVRFESQQGPKRQRHTLVGFSIHYKCGKVIASTVTGGT